jgi:integrase
LLAAALQDAIRATPLPIGVHLQNAVIDVDLLLDGFGDPSRTIRLQLIRCDVRGAIQARASRWRNLIIAESRVHSDGIAQQTPVMARNVLSYFSAFYTWALPRLDRLPGNPCRDAGRPPKPKARERVLSDAEIGALWHVLEEEGEPFGPAIKLLLLTGQRRNEVFEAERSEFDLAKKLWTVPASRAKNGVAHLVPMPPAVLEVVKTLNGHDRGVKLIPARGNWNAGPSGFSKAMSRIRLKLEGRIGEPVPHWTLHDLRRTMATGLQRLGVRLEVTEAVLNHLSGARSGIVGVYQRHHYYDEKRLALDAWSREVRKLARSRRAPKR